MNVEGKNILITGGASGIGRALAAAAIARGAGSITLVDRDPKVSDTADELGEEVFAFVADVGSEESMKNAISMAEELFGQLDIIVSNAGLAYGGDIHSPNHIWQKVWDVNVMAHVFAVRAVIDAWLERGSGYFVNVASAGGLLTVLGAAPYSVSKHAAVGFAEWVAATYGHRGINVSVVCPQGVKTAMLDDYEEHVSDVLLSRDAKTADEVAETILNGIEAEEFLILPHPEVIEYFRSKAQDWDGWLSVMQNMQKKFVEPAE